MILIFFVAISLKLNFEIDYFADKLLEQLYNLNVKLYIKFSCKPIVCNTVEHKTNYHYVRLGFDNSCSPNVLINCTTIPYYE